MGCSESNSGGASAHAGATNDDRSASGSEQQACQPTPGQHGELTGFVHEDQICVFFGRGYVVSECDLCMNTSVTEVLRRGVLQLCDPCSEEQRWW